MKDMTVSKFRFLPIRCIHSFLRKSTFWIISPPDTVKFNCLFRNNIQKRTGISFTVGCLRHYLSRSTISWHMVWRACLRNNTLIILRNLEKQHVTSRVSFFSSRDAGESCDCLTHFPVNVCSKIPGLRSHSKSPCIPHLTSPLAVKCSFYTFSNKIYLSWRHMRGACASIILT